MSPPDPCPPENIWVEEPSAGNCSVVWDEVPLVEYYMAFIKRDDGTEKLCNTTDTTCQFHCVCGYTYLTTVFPYNQAGSSPSAHVRNYTTSKKTHHQYSFDKKTSKERTKLVVKLLALNLVSVIRDGNFQ